MTEKKEIRVIFKIYCTILNLNTFYERDRDKSIYYIIIINYYPHCIKIKIREEEKHTHGAI